MSNIEEDIYNIKELLQGSKLYGKYDGNKYFKSIENILSEREADKKTIQELKKENEKYTIKLTDEEYRRLIENAQEDIKKQFEQKVIKNIKTYIYDWINESVKDYIIARQKKQIDLMAGYIATLDIEEDICEKTGKDLNECNCMSLGECENCIKQYFKSKAEKE